jgi:ArsR family transcriptional regulator
MESAELLDLLGNENRRRILQLLSRKPCYVTEIGEYLDVSPKAVIDHLQKLEDAGLVESRTDGSRRKYFHIAQDVRLEVTVSRHEYGTKSAYPASPGMDIRGRCAHVQLELDPSADAETDGETDRETDGKTDGQTADSSADDLPPTETSVEDLAAEYDRLRELENELSLAQRWVRGQIADVLDTIQETVGSESDAQFHADILAAVVSTDGTENEIVADIEAPPREVRRCLQRLGEAGVLDRTEDGWTIA